MPIHNNPNVPLWDYCVGGHIPAVIVQAFRIDQGTRLTVIFPIVSFSHCLTSVDFFFGQCGFQGESLTISEREISYPRGKISRLELCGGRWGGVEKSLKLTSSISSPVLALDRTMLYANTVRGNRCSVHITRVHGPCPRAVFTDSVYRTLGSPVAYVLHYWLSSAVGRLYAGHVGV